MHGVCQLFRGTIADLPALKCDECRHTILLTIHVHVGQEVVRYLCDSCGRRQSSAAKLPEALYLVPYISSMTWPKMRMRLERAKAMAELLKEYVLPEGHRWNRTHWGYRCELCARLIRGPRYQCMECPRWDSFCRDCWHDHDSNHALFIHNLPVGNVSPDPLAMPSISKISENEYVCGGKDSISIQSADSVTVQSMSPTEILMTYQALVLGVGHMCETPECWPSIANALANIYESMAEFMAKRDLPAFKGRTYIDFAMRHFDGHISADMREASSPRTNKRQSLTAQLLNRVFAAPASRGLESACFYIKLGNRTVFILRTMSEPTEFYRIELADAEGKPYETARVRSAFMQAIGNEITPFASALGNRILHSAHALEE
nr:hypothetical protein HK105_003717 [Polyrhizophydium stewartii]